MMGTELLLPAGRAECLKAAIAGGCDAVYFGGRQFNARKGADNFNDGELEQMIDYCHLHGVKAYITVNTLYLESEFESLMEFVEKAYSFGADAFIACDFGLISVLRYFKGIALHASTQMTAHSLNDVCYLESIGFNRVNISRETQLNTVNDIIRNTDCEIEVFAHGALCVCYSGRCLMSAFFGGRSGNRGDCAQPCRQIYTLCGPDGAEVKTGYLLSPKDICTVSVLPGILNSNVSSIKIEGRMKGPEYCAVTALAYSRAMEAYKGNGEFNAEEAEKELLQVFNRGGSFTGGYYNTHSGYGMMSPGTPKATGLHIGQVLEYNSRTKICAALLTEPVIPGDGIEISGSGTYINKAANAGAIISIKIEGDLKKGDRVYKTYGKALMDNARKIYEKDERTVEIEGRICAKQGERLKLTLSLGGVEAVAYAEAPGLAKTSPISAEELIERLSKTGSSTFTIKFTNTEIDVGLFIPVGVINKLKRDALELFSEKYIKSFKRQVPEYKQPKIKPTRNNIERKLSILVSDAEQLKEAVKAHPHVIYAQAQNDIIENADFYAKLCRTEGVLFYAALPLIDTKHTEELIEKLEGSGIDGYLVRTMGQLYSLSDTQKEITLDYTFNIFNPYASTAFSKGFNVTASVELKPGDMAGFGDNTEVIVYGKIPLMVTRQCPVGNYIGRDFNGSGPFCRLKGNEGGYFLVDRKGSQLALSCNCESCYALIYPEKPVEAKELSQTGVSGFRLQFTDEKPGKVKSIISSYKEKIRNGI